MDQCVLGMNACFLLWGTKWGAVFMRSTSASKLGATRKLQMTNLSAQSMLRCGSAEEHEDVHCILRVWAYHAMKAGLPDLQNDASLTCWVVDTVSTL